MAKVAYLLLVVFGVIGTCWSHSYHTGSCPEVKPMEHFDMSKMLGVWYVIQKTSTRSHCITYNFTKSETPGEFELEQISQHSILGLTARNHAYKYTGTLKVPDQANAAKMIVRFPLSVGGSASYVIFDTDYNHYAGIFTCQKLTFAHRLSATILSRTKEIPENILIKLHKELEDNSIDHEDLSTISHADCPKDEKADAEGTDLSIDPNTFSTAHAADVAHKAGDKIGDGFEYVVSAGKRVYNNLAHPQKQNSSELNKEALNVDVYARSGMPKDDAEWLP